MPKVGRQKDRLLKNRLKILIAEQYKTTSFVPTQDLLAELDMTSGRFRCLYSVPDRYRLRFDEAMRLADVFGFPVVRLGAEPPKNPRKAKPPTPIDFDAAKFKKKVLKKHKAI